jgi:hypothetical protein
MRRRVEYPPPTSHREFDRRADHILHELQKTLMPKHASEIVAINVETGEYVLASTLDAVYEAFQERWPEQISYVVRVDGGPVVKFHGK